MSIEHVFNQFNHEGVFHKSKMIHSGHINTTHLIYTLPKQVPDYILQKINPVVFKNIPDLIQNKVLVTDFLRSRASAGEKANILRLIPTKSGSYSYIDSNNNYWNMMVYIPESKVYLKAPDSRIAGEAGRLFGHFFYLLNDFEAEKLAETIPLFHDLDHRLQQLNDAINQASNERLGFAKNALAIIEQNKAEIYVLQELKDKGTLPLRACHNDTKLSNALFDTKGNGLAVIDLDTLMPGLVHYDFGDSVRTICSSAEEDEANLENVFFLPENFKAFSNGFLEACKNILSKDETDYLVLGTKYMVFIMGLRFLTDFLNKDIYFKTAYPDHNLVRAKNQFALLESIHLHENEMHKIIQEEG